MHFQTLQSGLVDWNGIESESDERVMERAGVGPNYRVFHASFGLFSLFVIQKLTIASLLLLLSVNNPFILLLNI